MIVCPKRGATPALLYTLSPLCRHCVGWPVTEGKSVLMAVTQPGLGHGGEVPGGQVPVPVRVHRPPSHPLLAACLL